MENLFVFIPAYNCAKTIGDTLNGIDISAKAAGIIVDVFVCNDCSTDDTSDVVQKYEGKNIKISLHLNEFNIGERATINKHWKSLLFQYKWALLIHADDIPKNDWIGIIYKEIESCDYRSVFTIWSSFDSFNHIGGNIYPGDNSGGINYNKRSLDNALFYLTKVTSSFHVSGAAFNLELFNLMEGFDDTMPQYGDTDFFARGMIAGFNDIYIKRTLTKYRIINTSVSSVSKRSSRDIKEMFYLINKYDTFLTKSGKRKIISLAIRYSLRRCFKSIALFRPSLFLYNLQLLIKSVHYSLMVNF